MWLAARLDPAQVARLKEARERLDLAPLVVHDNYLINLAAADPLIRRRSIAAFRGEMERALALGAEYLVAHPGSYGSQGLDESIGVWRASLAEAARGLKTAGLTLLLENTSGGGTKLGGRFEELKRLREAAGTVDIEIGYCLDTAHCLEAGYDVASAAGLEETVRQAEAELGLERVKVFHANDSRTPFGSHVDRHEHIGRGHIGREGFRRILRHRKLCTKPFILETPLETEGDDRRNVETLKELCRRKVTTTKKSS